MKRYILLLLVLVCILTIVLSACKKEETITTEKAKQIVLDQLGASEEEVHPHVHVDEYEGKPCYSVYVTVDGKNWEYLVDSTTGEILTYRESSHSH